MDARREALLRLRRGEILRKGSRPKLTRSRRRYVSGSIPTASISFSNEWEANSVSKAIATLELAESGKSYVHTGNFGLVVDRPWSADDRGRFHGHFAVCYIWQIIFGEALR